jgi:serine/threonine-protein kinase
MSAGLFGDTAVDMAAPPGDMGAPSDALPSADLTAAADMARATDLARAADLAPSADLAIAADLAPTADMATFAGNSYFPAGAPWTLDVTQAPLDAQSASIIGWLQSNGGWGNGHFQMDFSFNRVLDVSGSTPTVPLDNSAMVLPDCDKAPALPLPPGGQIEGESGYQCTTGGDCHLLLIDRTARVLYELYHADLVSGVMHTSCLVRWDLNRIYPPDGRGEQCTSTDAAGFPVAPLLFMPEEIAQGHIDHALRFALPNPRMAAQVYVHPASHAGAPSGPATAVPYGAHFRLRLDYPISSLPTRGAQIVARALQTYGMYLADDGIIPLMGVGPLSSYGSDFAGSRDLDAIQPSDFEMLNGGARVPLTYNCVRNLF